MKAFAEINEKGDRIQVTFPYDANAVKAIKDVPGARFVPPPKGGPHWLLPLDLTSARRLREGFGQGLELGAALRAWGHKRVTEERNLRDLASADNAELTVLPKVRPDLAEYLRGYQRADVKFMATTDCINANQPGAGKTVETIAAMYEGELIKGQHLVIAPVTSLETVWQFEFEKWTDLPVLTGDTPARRKEAIAQAQEMAEDGQDFVLVVNPAMVSYVRNKELEKVLIKGRGEYPLMSKFPFIHEHEWTTVVFDEYHKMGLTNTKTNTFKAANDLKAQRKFLLSGTPMGGKPIKLWGALHFIDPGAFTSKWRWADQWLVVEDNGFGKSIQGLQSGREDDFYAALAPYMVRRTTKEIMPELPDTLRIDVWCKMTDAQAKQYETFALNAELKIEEENLSATGVLAEYTRLKQFAGARHTIGHKANGELKLVATEDSGKIKALWERLEERGIVGDDRVLPGTEGAEKAIIGSQFKEIADMVYEQLTNEGVKCVKITGDVTGKNRKAAVDAFQEGDAQVAVMTTTAGGMSITLNKAHSVHVLDETWDPDDQEQLESRTAGARSIHKVTAYYYRSEKSIEEYIEQVVADKGSINREILDLRRKGFRAIKDAR